LTPADDKGLSAARLEMQRKIQIGSDEAAKGVCEFSGRH
jgi:hypothetical protein